MKKILRLTPIAILVAILFFSCNTDQLIIDREDCLIDASYNVNVKEIINASCAFHTECHGQGSSYGDFSTYRRMEPVLNARKFDDRVLITRNMPPDYANEVGGATMLTEDQMQILRCWSQNDFPE